jgi:predicted DCC family thiol-disulfide oxidoreductase YuxK
VRAHDADRRVLVLPNQTPGIRQRVHLSKAEVDRAAWAITTSGARFEGAAAINRVLRELPRWRWLASLYALPLIKPIEDRIYQWIATHRHLLARWGAVPECTKPNVACLPEGE